nr:hypothetical protein [uncultured Butyrivibrio sp.]
MDTCVNYIKKEVLSISKEEYQRLDFELEAFENGGFSEKQIRQRLKVNNTFKKVIALLAIDGDKDHLIPIYIKESPIVKRALSQM